MAVCERCGDKVPRGLIHVPAELVGGHMIAEGTIDSPGEYEPLPERGCNAVTLEQLHAYLAAHCENCGGALDPGMAHRPLVPGSCALGPTEAVGSRLLRDGELEPVVLTHWTG